MEADNSLAFSKPACPKSGSWKICAYRSGAERVWRKSCGCCTGRKLLVWVGYFTVFMHFSDLTKKSCHEAWTETVWNERVFPWLENHIDSVTWTQPKIRLPFPQRAVSSSHIDILLGLSFRCLERLKGESCQAGILTLGIVCWLQTAFSLLVLTICCCDNTSHGNQLDIYSLKIMPTS